MASKTSQRVAVESDFLLGLRKPDARHSNVVSALKKHREGSLLITPLSSAVMEVRAVLYSRGMRPEEVEEVFTLMASILADYNIPEPVSLSLSDVVAAEKMRNDWPTLTYFDSLHAATSKRLGVSLLSSEGVYARLGLPVIDLDKFGE